MTLHECVACGVIVTGPNVPSKCPACGSSTGNINAGSWHSRVDLTEHVDL